MTSALHTSALTTLDEWVPPTPGQAVLRDRYLTHLRAEPLGVLRECYPDHLTASTLVMSADGSRVLLTLHRKARRWFQLGGHVEPRDASLTAAALREATEESGVAGLTLLPGGPVRLDRHPIPPPCHFHFDVQYAALATPDAVHAVSDESLDVRWFPYDEVPQVADDSVVRLLDATRARLGA